MSVTNYPLVSGVITGSGGGGTWGSITGTLSDQTDLQAALDLKDDKYDPFFDNDRANVFYTDFLQNDRATLGVATNVGGGSAITTTNDSSTGVDATERCAGVYEMILGTGTTARACIFNSGVLTFGHNENWFRARCALSALSDGTNTYTTYIGFGDNPSAGDMTDGAYFRYNSGVNGGRWEAVVADAGARTAGDTGVSPTATVHQVFLIISNEAGTEVRFYIDGTLVYTHTTGLPGAGDFFFYLIKIEKSAGTTAGRSIAIDGMGVKTVRSAVR